MRIPVTNMPLTLIKRNVRH